MCLEGNVGVIKNFVCMQLHKMSHLYIEISFNVNYITKASEHK